MSLFTILLNCLLLFTSTFSQSTCAPATPAGLDFTSEEHVLKINGDRLYLQGATWFGFETTNYCVDGIWTVSYESVLDFYVTYGLNAIRLPFSVELVMTNPMPVSINYYQNPDLQNLTSLQIMDVIIAAAANRGLLVMLDMHTLEAGNNAGLWYDSKYSANDTQNVWGFMVNRYKDYWNVIGIDVFNEAYSAQWGNGDPSNDYKMWCETIGNYVHSLGVKWLIIVEGIGNVGGACNPTCFWGENLVAAGDKPVNLNMDKKLVYSPHDYGPSVANQSYFNDPNFPNNMPDIWYQHWGYLHNYTTGINGDAAIVVGEWGGYLDNSSDSLWMNEFADYLSNTIDSPSTFFWCWNYNSFTTGGLVQSDWKTPVIAKINLLQSMEPLATVLTYDSSNNQVCW